MRYELFESLVAQVVDPRKFLLNYSGESTVYPHLIPAIRLARSTGAAVELVTALASASEELVDELASSGLTRLTVSVHATGSERFTEIYRYGSFDGLRMRLARFVKRGRCVAIDLAFVAMRQNLRELPGVAALAAELGLRSISIFPVIRRDEIPVMFPELERGSVHTAEFRDELNRLVESVDREQPDITLTICNPRFTDTGARLGEIPVPCPGDLPAGAAIHSCEQNPWETAHILANGDVVPCEVHDRLALGSMARQSLVEIWHGEPYRRFRERYRAGGHAECRGCPWKTAFVPGPLRGEIVAARGRSAQMAYGWHEPDGEPHVWASQQATAVVQPAADAAALHIHGMLPPGPTGTANRLSISCNGASIGELRNEGADLLTFGVDLPVHDASAIWEVEFRTDHVYCAAGDQRDLGFALVAATAKPRIDPWRTRRQQAALRPLMDAITAIDRVGGAMAKRFRRCRPEESQLLPLASGLTVIVPERDSPAELVQCLDGLEAATRFCHETVEAIVVVNGADPSRYDHLRAAHRWMHWQFHPRPLGFCGAVAAGLRRAAYDWVYLLNSDAVIEPTALAEAGRWRAPLTFSVASQIYLKDQTRYREETNWTRILVEDGLATVHDLIPQSCAAVEHFYAGGGASLFQTRLLRRLLRPRLYHPFYWEDVEWGWRARKLGYRSIFCAASVAHHTQRATIARHYPEEQVEAVLQRNRLLFQLRNLTAAGSIEKAIGAIAGGPPEAAEYFVHPSTLAAVVRGRLWNHVAPVPDSEVLANGAAGQCIEQPS